MSTEVQRPRQYPTYQNSTVGTHKAGMQLWSTLHRRSVASLTWHWQSEGHCLSKANEYVLTSDTWLDFGKKISTRMVLNNCVTRYTTQ